ncbi:MAG: CDP-6-deoxy-delta-3,4-glucoseen reductase [Betaproteobacteria bacterium]|jgi:CDP-4-dehydro-6-deoxyglucose reductase|nr:CDP-6-deoxy-delta-3,4-glucoseen reductase [Betaproteobacteria bacterium]MDH4292457.1 CDP-6-deoxy-delta-3,4-glucoseen reductase [Betaproteobacteria bacterium]MDH5341434.1 CDP-6-deoxy-delta-3,4-glucoseen reductase [Betaproteobacteria bacterium]
MSRQITIRPSGHIFHAQDGETILEAALREGFMLPYGCRNGACGSCKGKVVEGDIDHGRPQETALSGAERDLGMALFCQACARSDLVIECREIGTVKDIPVKTLPCRVQTLELISPDVMRIRLRLPAAERLQFLAGQYIDILLKDGTRRSLSMANPPHDDNLLELHLRNYGGSFSEHVFTRMKEKDILRFEGPLGSFFLREDSDKPVVLIAGGTGFAPIKAIIEHALHHGIKRPMTLYRGARHAADLYLNELPERWQRESGIRYIPVLSDVSPEEQWGGRRGLVHQAVMADLPDLSGYEVYACGAPAMIDAARLDLCTHNGLPEAAFHADAFTPAVPAGT